MSKSYELSTDVENNIVLNTLLKQIEEQETVSQDLMPYLKKDLEVDSKSTINWKDLYNNLVKSNKIYKQIFFLYVSIIAIFTLLGVALVSAMLVLGFVTTLITMFGLVIWPERNSIPANYYNSIQEKSPLFLHIESKDNKVFVCMKKGEEVIKTEVFNASDNISLQETVIEWEEEIKSYNDIHHTTREEYSFLLEDQQNSLEPVFNSFDKNITLVDKDKNVNENNLEYKEKFMQNINSTKKFIKFAWVGMTLCAVGFLSVGIFAIQAKRANFPEVDKLAQAVENLNDNYYDKHNSFPSKGDIEAFIKTQNQEGVIIKTDVYNRFLF